MAKIKVVSEIPLFDGMAITFNAPCECSAVDGLTVSYHDISRSFAFRDAHGNDLTGLGNLFAEGTYVKAVLDTENGYAYLQNADTNAYIENTFLKRTGGTMTSDLAMGGKNVTGLPGIYDLYKSGPWDAAVSKSYVHHMGIPSGGSTGDGVNIDTVGQCYITVNSGNPIWIGDEKYYSGHILTFQPYGNTVKTQLFFDKDGNAFYRVAWFDQPYCGWYKFATTSVG